MLGYATWKATRASPRGSVFVLLGWRERCTRCATRETLRIAHVVDPNRMDLAFAHHASSWIVSEFLRSAVTLSMDEAGKLIALVQAPVGSVIEEIDGTRLVLADVSIKSELLILLHGRYPDRVTRSTAQKPQQAQSRQCKQCAARTNQRETVPWQRGGGLRADPHGT